MTYYNIIGLIFNSISVLIPCYLLLFKRRDMAYDAFALLLCFACAFSYDFKLLGLVNLQQLLLVMITVFGLNRVRNNDLRQNTINRNIYAYLGYISIITIFFYYVKSDYLLTGTIIQNQLRPYVQIVFEVFTFLALSVLITLDGNSSKRILIIFYKVLLVMAIIGIAQSLIYRVTSFDILPMRKDFVSESEGLSAIAENGFLRATAGVGEPKQLGKFMGIGMAMQMVSHKLLGYEKIKISHILIFVAAIFFTSSTTGYILMLAAFGFFCLKNGSKYKVLGPLFFAMIIVAAILVFKSDIVANKLDKSEAVGDIVGLENTDTAAVRWLLAEPLFGILGVGLSNTVAYANRYATSFDHFINSYPYTLRRGWVYNLAETGVVGTFLFLGIVNKLYKSCKHNGELKFMFLFLIFMYMFLTKEAVLILQIFMMALLSNCGEMELKNQAFS